MSNEDWRSTGIAAFVYQRDAQPTGEKGIYDLAACDPFNYEEWLAANLPAFISMGSNAAGSSAAERILSILTNQNVRKGSSSVLQLDEYRPVFLSQIQSSIDRDKPIRLVLPSFPFKFPSPWITPNTAGGDLADILALTQLAGICTAVEQVYGPGMEILIAQDSFIYADLFAVQADTVIKYQEGLRESAGQISPRLKFVDVARDLIPNFPSWSEVVDRKIHDISSRWQEIKNSPEVRSLFVNSTRNLDLSEVIHGMYKKYNTYQDISFEALYDMILSDPRYLGDPRMISTINAMEEFTMKYLALCCSLRELEVYRLSYPDHIRARIDPKPGQISLHLVNKKTQRLPWSGLGVVRYDEESQKGEARIITFHEWMRSPHRYFPIRNEGYEGIFGLQELSESQQQHWVQTSLQKHK
jgi:hypothetical protein